MAPRKSWWLDAPRENFTSFAKTQIDDEDVPREVKLYLQEIEERQSAEMLFAIPEVEDDGD